MEKNRLSAFTLAEALITIAVIGIIAAITLPSLLSNYEERQYYTARLKALKTFGEAGKMASINNVMTGQENAKNFVNNVLSKYLKITKVCDTAAECDFPSKIRKFEGNDKVISDDTTKWTQLGYSMVINSDNLSTYIETNDGFSAKLLYNPNCLRDSTSNQIVISSTACMNVIYDMNGTKEPNHVGEDIGFVTVFWSGMRTSSAAPSISSYMLSQGTISEASEYCESNNTKKVRYSLPTIDEASSIRINEMLIGRIAPYDLWSGTAVVDKPGYMWYVQYAGHRMQLESSKSLRAYCIERR